MIAGAEQLSNEQNGRAFALKMLAKKTGEWQNTDLVKAHKAFSHLMQCEHEIEEKIGHHHIFSIFIYIHLCFKPLHLSTSCRTVVLMNMYALYCRM